MNKAVATAFALFVIGMLVGLYGEFSYQARKVEYDQSAHRCDPDTDIFCRGQMVYGSEWPMREAQDMRNTGYAFAIGAPIAIWLLVLLVRVATSAKVKHRVAEGAQVGRRAVDELGKRSASATKQVVGAVAQVSDSAQGRTRECPFCAEMIKPQAKVCRHCGKDVA